MGASLVWTLCYFDRSPSLSENFHIFWLKNMFEAQFALPSMSPEITHFCFSFLFKENDFRNQIWSLGLHNYWNVIVLMVAQHIELENRYVCAHVFVFIFITVCLWSLSMYSDIELQERNILNFTQIIWHSDSKYLTSALGYPVQSF